MVAHSGNSGAPGSGFSFGASTQKCPDGHDGTSYGVGGPGVSGSAEVGPEGEALSADSATGAHPGAINATKQASRNRNKNIGPPDLQITTGGGPQLVKLLTIYMRRMLTPHRHNARNTVYFPSIPVLSAAVGGLGPSQMPHTTFMKSAPATVPLAVPSTLNVVPVPGTYSNTMT